MLTYLPSSCFSPRPAELISILVHPISPTQVPDHTTRAMWLGEKLTLKAGLLHQADKMTKEKGQGEVEAILSIAAH